MKFELECSFYGASWRFFDFGSRDYLNAHTLCVSMTGHCVGGFFSFAVELVVFANGEGKWPIR